MNETLQVTVTVQVESVGNQYVRARALPPWRVQTVGHTWSEASVRLTSLLTRAADRMLPERWFEGALGEQAIVSTTTIELEPNKRDVAWQIPIELSLATFRWELADRMCVVRVPAVKCSLFGKSDDLDDQTVTQQVRIALLRASTDLNLWQVRERFLNRVYEYRTLQIEVDPKRGIDKQATSVKHKKRTATLRAAASDLGRVRLESVHGMDQRAGELARMLGDKEPKSVLLVGPAGVGKSALVHRLVQLAGQFGMSDRTVWSTSGARIVSGMSGFGMWQQRCLKLIREAHETRAILHLGSIVELMEAGKIDGQPGVASMLRQAISRRRFWAIAECTPDQIAIVEREDPLLLRAFQRMDVAEPDAQGVTDILRRAAIDRCQVHAADKQNSSDAVAFTDGAIEELYRLHRRYSTYSALPAQPLRLMQTILENAPPGAIIDAPEVAQAFSAQTGLPQFLVDDRVEIDLAQSRRELGCQVIGQSEPVELIVNLLATLKTRLVRPGRPLASLLFIGPTGVGKTETAKALAKLLYSDTRRMIRIDMSEYASPWSALRLIGRPDEGDGTLTSPIREQPFSVVLLDEFEKADPAVFDLLLQLLGEGRLTDSLGRLADFRNSVVIMTSNLGVSSFRDVSFGFGEGGQADWRAHFEREVQRFVRPELLGRIDRIVPFHPLSSETVRQIAVRELELLKYRPGVKYADVQLEFSPEVVDHVSQVGYQPKYGARPLRRAIEELVTVPLADTLCDLSGNASWNIRVGMQEGKVAISAERRPSSTRAARRTDEALIDRWQTLGRMARLVESCDPLRNLENEIDRLRRTIILLRKTLKTVEAPGRILSLKREIRINDIAMEQLCRTRDSLLSTSGRIREEHLRVMLAWHRNEPFDTASVDDRLPKLESELKLAVAELVEGRRQRTDSLTIVILGKMLPRASVLWRTYAELVSRQKWSLDIYSMRAYDPALDPDTAEHRRRQSQAKSRFQDELAERKPVLRLLSPEVGQPQRLVKACDVFREESIGKLDSLDPATVGVALQLRGDGVGAWLGNEQGIVHFIDHQSAGQKKRLRYRVIVETQRLVGVTLPNTWLDPASDQERDPRRVFLVADQTIEDSLSGRKIAWAQGKQVDALLALIEWEREQTMWRAIGFEGIPTTAKLLSEESCV